MSKNKKSKKMRREIENTHKLNNFRNILNSYNIKLNPEQGYEIKNHIGHLFQEAANRQDFSIIPFESVLGVPLKEVEFEPAESYMSQIVTKEFESHRTRLGRLTRRDFAIILGNCQNANLAKYGFNDEQALQLASGHIPDGFAVHHKIPRSIGGDNVKANLCLISEEKHQFIHSLINKQLNCFKKNEAGIVLLPINDGFIFSPNSDLEMIGNIKANHQNDLLHYILENKRSNSKQRDFSDYAKENRVMAY